MSSLCARLLSVGVAWGMWSGDATQCLGMSDCGDDCTCPFPAWAYARYTREGVYMVDAYYFIYSIKVLACHVGTNLLQYNRGCSKISN